MSSERRNLIIAIIVSFVFGISGGMLGTLGALSYLRHQGGMVGFMHGPGHGPAMGMPGERGEMRSRGPRRPMMERFVHRQLDLSAEQQTRIEEILDAARPRYAAVRESTHAEIQRLLTAEQRAKWNELEERFPNHRHEPDRP